VETFRTAVRLGGLRLATPELIAASMRERDLIDDVAIHNGPDGWQVELRVTVRHDDLQGAVVYSALVARGAIAVARTPVERIAVAAHAGG
jgi:hypothetical protein